MIQIWTIAVGAYEMRKRDAARASALELFVEATNEAEASRLLRPTLDALALRATKRGLALVTLPPRRALYEETKIGETVDEWIARAKHDAKAKKKRATGGGTFDGGRW